MRYWTLLTVSAVTIVLVMGIAPVLGQDDLEHPERYPGVWYRISVDAGGQLLVGDGDGVGWYYYPQSNMYRMWFYNGPYDRERRGHLEYHVYVKAVDRTKRTYVEMYFGWTTPEWSKLGRDRPPTPDDMPTESEEATYMAGNHVYTVDSSVQGSVEAVRGRSIDDYNPEWVCIGFVARNAYIYRGAFHECGPESSAGACCNRQTGACYQSLEEDCQAPFEWLGAGTTCDQCTRSEVATMDFGDAPDAGYQTLKSNNGARHRIVTGVFLGNTVDGEVDAKANAAATGDDGDGVDDEDGVVFVSTLRVGQDATINVTASTAGYLNAWVDFNADGRFRGAEEQVFFDERLSHGANQLAFRVPAGAHIGWTFARFRFNTLGLLDSFGPADDGEVEDYQVQIATSQGPNPDPDPNPGTDPGAGEPSGQQVTVQDTMDYTDNVWDDELGVWFVPPNSALDSSPWHRMSNQDWGWMHDVSALVPADATGIQSATLTINAWDVNHGDGEDDVIYVDTQNVGHLTGVYRAWQSCTFTLPASVLAGLWQTKTLYVYMDIDRVVSSAAGGFRVTLGSSILSVKYYVSGAATPATIPVYRFWSPVFSGHFYTTDEAERDWLISSYPDVWTYETIAYRTLASQGNTIAKPVYRFWSDVYASHFYTLDEAEKQWLIDTYPDVWTYETTAFHAYAPGTQPSGTVPVYRFWSPVYAHHFYTTSEDERQWLIDVYPDVWTYETVAWYAYEP